MPENFPDQERAEQEFVTVQLLKLRSAQSKKVFFSVIGITLTMASIYYAPDNLPSLAGWCSLVMLGQVVRMLVQRKPMENLHSLELQRRTWYDAAASTFNGMALALGLLYFVNLSAIPRGLITLVIITVMEGAISTSAGHPKTYWGFCIVQIVPLGMCWMLVPSAEYSPVVGWAFGATILFGFAPVLYSQSRSTWRIFDESCRIRFRERALNQRLHDALRAAHKANQTKTRFLAAASHDLRQPLHTISFVAAALSLRTLDSQTSSMVELLNKVSVSLSLQLESLLDISKLDAGVVQADLHTIDVFDLILKYHSEFAPLAYEKKLETTLHMRGKQGSALVHTDALLLQRIVMNLCQNALKFTQHGHVDLLVNAAPQVVEITITDTGCGIAAELQSEVFQEFFQVANHERDASKGMGLGLSIVQRLCDLLNIRLRLESVPGRGTSVCLSMDRCLESTATSFTAAAANPVHLRLALQHHVLVIDDEMTVRQAARFLLQELGCSVDDCADLPTAQQLCRQRVPDLILVDLRLRDSVNGVDVLNALRNEFGSIAALLITGDTSPDRLQLARAAHVPLCHKPLSAEKLTHELNRLLPTR